MHNDSKLGLLAGVGGVVVAAVLMVQQNSITPASESAKNTTPPGPQVIPASTPVNMKAPAAATPIAARNRPELAGRTTSRPARSDDDE
jgi:hypothetical protein